MDSVGLHRRAASSTSAGLKDSLEGVNPPRSHRTSTPPCSGLSPVLSGLIGKASFDRVEFGPLAKDNMFNRVLELAEVLVSTVSTHFLARSASVILAESCIAHSIELKSDETHEHDRRGRGRGHSPGRLRASHRRPGAGGPGPPRLLQAHAAWMANSSKSWLSHVAWMTTSHVNRSGLFIPNRKAANGVSFVIASLTSVSRQPRPRRPFP